VHCPVYRVFREAVIAPTVYGGAAGLQENMPCKARLRVFSLPAMEWYIAGSDNR